MNAKQDPAVLNFATGLLPPRSRVVVSRDLGSLSDTRPSEFIDSSSYSKYLRRCHPPESDLVMPDISLHNIDVVARHIHFPLDCNTWDVFCYLKGWRLLLTQRRKSVDLATMETSEIHDFSMQVINSGGQRISQDSHIRISQDEQLFKTFWR